MLNWEQVSQMPYQISLSTCGGLINMTKKCHFGKFMGQRALCCFVAVALFLCCNIADGQDNIYDAVWLVFQSNRFSCRTYFRYSYSYSVRVKWAGRGGNGLEITRDARTISLSLKQLILLFRWHLASTGLSSYHLHQHQGGSRPANKKRRN